MKDDAISRQTAIDVINESNSPIAEYLIGEIMALPSAQPKSYREGYQAGFKDAQPEPRWVSCSERLPEKNCICLTTNTALGAFEVDWNVWINGEWLYQNEKPIAWRPLPEPYKEDDHETD